jgi:hypothetical protein
MTDITDNINDQLYEGNDRICYLRRVVPGYAYRGSPTFWFALKYYIAMTLILE